MFYAYPDRPSTDGQANRFLVINDLSINTEAITVYIAIQGTTTL